ncbi:ABC transporter permease subunit [bacterium]|nr:ABC transporter permease subunit [bacterium]
MARARSGFAGSRRSMATRKSVRVADRTAQLLITVGGLGTIASLLLVFAFLVGKVYPLFSGSSLSQPQEIDLSAATQPVTPDTKAPASKTPTPEPLHFATDEYLNLGWIAYRDGTLRTVRLDSGETLSRVSLIPDGRELTAWSFGPRGEIGLGFVDGDIQLGKISFATAFLQASSDDDAAAGSGDTRVLQLDEVPAELTGLRIGDVARYRDGMVEKTPEGQLRLQELSVEMDAPVTVASGVPIRLIDRSVPKQGADSLAATEEVLALLTDEGLLRVATVRKVYNMLLDQTTTKLSARTLQLELDMQTQQPDRLLLSGLGDNVYLAWNDGRLQRFDARKGVDVLLAEEVNLVDGGRVLTSLGFLVGKTSLVAGDSDGGVTVWFRTKPEDATTIDGAVLSRAHHLQSGSSPVRSLAASPVVRTVAAGFEDGSIRLYHVTSEQLLAQSTTADQQVPRLLTISPKNDVILGLSHAGLSRWAIDAPHPEVTLSAIFLPVWYEGYEKPEHVWQSSSGDDAFEPKYGLWSLVFGSIKATIYSMLFGAPLALLAAIYTSEFLNPRTKARIKPTIEIMASLPSVVLGFLAALVIAPYVEDIVPQTLSVLATAPFALLAAAFLWQLLPMSLGIRCDWLRLPLMALAFVVGIWLATIVGPFVESWLFAGDIKAWLDGQTGTATGGWMLLLLPLSALLVATVFSLFVTPVQRNMANSRVQFVLLDIAKFAVGSVATVAVAWLISSLISGLGFDLRGTLVDTYVQRNSLVVGFMMGFAIIPIIYTISDDALTSVPESLRAASLGAGATKWQTAVRVIIPTGMSGLFSAVMIGLGRAVGETMIVLMAAGNTPVLDMNIFNGFRTLAANIAVELPEAVENSTHFRMLYLAALTLFALTFVLNTVAEVIRLRFRKRAFQL